MIYLYLALSFIIGFVVGGIAIRFVIFKRWNTESYGDIITNGSENYIAYDSEEAKDAIDSGQLKWVTFRIKTVKNT